MAHKFKKATENLKKQRTCIEEEEALLQSIQGELDVERQKENDMEAALIELSREMQALHTKVPAVPANNEDTIHSMGYTLEELGATLTATGANGDMVLQFKADLQQRAALAAQAAAAREEAKLAAAAKAASNDASKLFFNNFNFNKL